MRKVFGLAAGVATVLLLAACGGGGGGDGSDPGPAPPLDDIRTERFDAGYYVWRPDLKRETTVLTFTERTVTRDELEISVDSTLSYPLQSQLTSQSVQSSDRFVSDKRFSGLATVGELRIDGLVAVILSCAGDQQNQGYLAVPANVTEGVLANLAGKRFSGGDCIQGTLNSILINVVSTAETTISDSTGVRTVPTAELFSDQGYRAGADGFERAIAYKIPGPTPRSVSYVLALLSEQAGVKRVGYGMAAP